MSSSQQSSTMLLQNPHLNRGTAFTLDQRAALGLEGLLPPMPTNIETQVARIIMQLDMFDSDIQKYLFLSTYHIRFSYFWAERMALKATHLPLQAQLDLFYLGFFK